MCSAELSDESSEREHEAGENRDAGRKARNVARESETEKSRSGHDQKKEEREREAQKEERNGDTSSSTEGGGVKRAGVVRDLLGEDDEKTTAGKKGDEETQSRDPKEVFLTGSSQKEREEWLLGRLKDESIPYITVNSSIGKYFIEDENTSSAAPKRTPIAEEKHIAEDLQNDADQSGKSSYKTQPSENISMGGQAHSTPRPSPPKEEEQENKTTDKPSRSVSETVNMLRESGLPGAKLREGKPPAPSFLATDGNNEGESMSSTKAKAGKAVPGAASSDAGKSPGSVMASQSSNRSTRTVSIGLSERVTAGPESSARLSQATISTRGSNNGSSRPEEALYEESKNGKKARSVASEKTASVEAPSPAERDDAEKTVENGVSTSAVESRDLARKDESLAENADKTDTDSMRSGASKSSGTETLPDSAYVSPDSIAAMGGAVTNPRKTQENVFNSTTGSTVGNSHGVASSDSKDKITSIHSTVSGGTKAVSHTAPKGSIESVDVPKSTSALSGGTESVHPSVASNGSSAEKSSTTSPSDILPSARPTPPPSLKPFVAPPIPFPGPTGLPFSPDKSKEIPGTEETPQEAPRDQADKTAEPEESSRYSVTNADKTEKMEQEAPGSAKESRRDDSTGRIEVLGSGVPSIRNPSTVSARSVHFVPSDYENAVREASVASTPVIAPEGGAAGLSEDLRSGSVSRGKSISSRKDPSAPLQGFGTETERGSVEEERVVLSAVSEAKKQKHADLSENAEWRSTPSTPNNLAGIESNVGSPASLPDEKKEAEVNVGATVSETGSRNRTVSDVFSKIKEVGSAPEVPLDHEEPKSSEGSQGLGSRLGKRDSRGVSAAGSVAASSSSRGADDVHLDAAVGMVSSPETLRSTEVSSDTMLGSSLGVSQGAITGAGITGNVGRVVGYGGAENGYSSTHSSPSQNTSTSRRSSGSKIQGRSATMDAPLIVRDEAVGIGGLMGIGTLEAMLGERAASDEPGSRTNGLESTGSRLRECVSVKSSSSTRGNGREQASASIPIAEQLRMMEAGPSTCQCVRNSLGDRNGSSGVGRGSVSERSAGGFVSGGCFSTRRPGCGCSVCNPDESNYSLLEGIEAVAMAPETVPSETPRKEIRLSVDHGSKEDLCVIRILIPGECKERIERRSMNPSEPYSASSSISGMISGSRSGSVITFSEPEEVAGNADAPEETQLPEGSSGRGAEEEENMVEVEHPEKASVKKLINYYESLSKGSK